MSKALISVLIAGLLSTTAVTSIRGAWYLMPRQWARAMPPQPTSASFSLSPVSAIGGSCLPCERIHHRPVNFASRRSRNALTPS